MASLTGNTIQSTYDALLKVTDNGSITGSLKRITDGLGNNTPLYLSNSAAEFTSALNVTGAITGSNLSGTNTGDETNASIKSKLGAATGSNDGYLTSADWTTFMAKIAGSGTLNKLAKFSSSSSIADSTITDTGSAVTIGVATSVTGSLTASSIIKSGGTSSQFLKADGSIDSNSYALASSLSSYVPTSRTLTINGTAYDLSADRSWTISPSQWVTSGSNIYYNTGNVGIGTTTPYYKLHVRATTNANFGVRAATDFNAGFSGTAIGSFNDADNANTNLYLESSQLGLNLQSGQRVLIGGNVGIGTSSPAEVLDVNGSINVRGGQLYAGSDGSNTIFLNAVQHIFRAGSSGSFAERMRITSAGNVGIGTSSPSYTLDVNGTGRFGGNISSSPLEIANTLLSNYIFANSGSGYEAMTRYYNPTAGNWYTGIRVSAGLGSTSSYHIYSSTYGGDVLALNTNGTAAFAGNVGIGTTSPQAPLQVVGTGIGGYGLISARGENAHLGFRTAADAFKGWVGYFNSATHGSDVDLNIKTGYNGASNIRFGINGDSGEAMRITSAGNVGIGTSSPSEKLDVLGTMNLSAPSGTYIQLQYNGSSRGYIGTANAVVASGSTGDLGISSPSNLVFGSGGSLTERMRITSGGNVGIGTTSPSTLLDVAGTATVQVLNISASAGLVGNVNSSNANGGYLTWQTSGTTIADIGTLQQIFGAGGSTNFGINARGARDLGFGTNNTERMRITSAGNVGIGTTTFTYAASGRGNLAINGSTDSILEFKNADSSSGYIFSNSTTLEVVAVGSRSIPLTTNGVERMRINSGGSVLIGTTSDIFNNAKLQVNGGMTYQNLFNRRTASYTLSISDQNYIVEMNVGSANNLTVPPNSSVAFPVGTEIAILQYGAGQTTIVAGSGVTLKSKSNALKISGQYAGCTLVKVGTDEWYVVGDLTL